VKHDRWAKPEEKNDKNDNGEAPVEAPEDAATRASTQSSSAQLARILALDVGSKRIGVAISDPLGITAQGLDTIQRQNKRRDYEALGQVLEKYAVREIVVGLPLRLSGAEGTQSEKMRRFADELHAHFGVTVHLWDERWTSTEANRLLRETDLSIKKRGQAVDRMAAILILQSWMGAHPGR
jgi:putative Holliday junction resolvase